MAFYPTISSAVIFASHVSLASYICFAFCISPVVFIISAYFHCFRHTKYNDSTFHSYISSSILYLDCSISLPVVPFPSSHSLLPLTMPYTSSATLQHPISFLLHYLLFSLAFLFDPLFPFRIPNTRSIIKHSYTFSSPSTLQLHINPESTYSLASLPLLSSPLPSLPAPHTQSYSIHIWSKPPLFTTYELNSLLTRSTRFYVTPSLLSPLTFPIGRTRFPASICHSHARNRTEIARLLFPSPFLSCYGSGREIKRGAKHERQMDREIYPVPPPSPSPPPCLEVSVLLTV